MWICVTSLYGVIRLQLGFVYVLCHVNGGDYREWDGPKGPWTFSFLTAEFIYKTVSLTFLCRYNFSVLKCVFCVKT